MLFAAVVTWPLASHPASVLASPEGPGDAFLNLWILGWDLQTLATRPADLLTGRIFDATIFHPATSTLAYSDHLVLQAIVLLPLYLLTRDLVLCYNALLFGSLVASALAMHRYVREVVGTERGAYAAGLIWGFGPFHFSHLIHLQLQALYFLPLAFLYLHRLIAAHRRSDAVKLGVVAALQAVSSVYYGVIGAVGLATATAALAVVSGCWRRGILIRRFLLVASVSVLLVAPFVWPYDQLQRREGFGRNLFQASQNSARLVSYLRVNPFNALYGRTEVLRPSPNRGANDPREGHERELFPGFAALGLAAAGLWLARKGEARATLVSLAAVSVVGLVLSLGPDGIRSVYSTFHGLVFGAQAIRAPARFAVLVVFAVAGLAAVGMKQLSPGRPAKGSAFEVSSPWLVSALLALARPARRGPLYGSEDETKRKANSRKELYSGPILAGMLVVLAAEYMNAPIPYAPAPALRTPVGEWLARAPAPGAVVYLPLGLDIDNTPAMIESLEHRRPIVNGYSGQRPAFYPALVENLADFPAPSALWTLKDLDVRFVVTRGDVPSPPSPLVLRATLDRRRIYELVWTPDAEASLPRPSVPAPPPAGPVPFRVGEETTYRVLWTGGAGAMNVSAGTIRIGVADPRQADATYRFELSAETADWVSRFFQARDRFVSWSDAGLFPLAHEQQLREGRRVLDRTFVFDRAAGVVRTFNGPAGAERRPDAKAAGPALPMAEVARDPMTTYFYARTLPLAPGLSVRIPVTDAGRNLTVDLRVSDGSIEYRGRPTSALRVEPRLEYRIQRRAAPSVVVWMSRDERRIPLVIEVDAVFGSFRAELVSHTPGRQPLR